MESNFDKIKKDLDQLIDRSLVLNNSACLLADPEAFRRQLRKILKNDEDKVSSVISKMEPFSEIYESWYSESLSVITHLLPSRISDFKSHYEVPRTRKELSPSNYTVHDMIQGLSRVDGSAPLTSGLSRLRSQINILKAARQRFTSTLFDIKKIVQADLLDSEIEVAKLLLTNGFTRAAGAVAGVVIERHLSQICLDHAISIKAKHPTIATLNDALKDATAVDLAQWRFIQHLADIRNNCDHAKTVEPTHEQVSDLIAGTAKIIKTIT